jgi:hypothetical protein
LLNVRLPIGRVVKTLSSCEDVDYRCYRVVKQNFHNSASILGNVKQKALLFVGAVGVNNVAKASISN